MSRGLKAKWFLASNRRVYPRKSVPKRVLSLYLLVHDQALVLVLNQKSVRNPFAPFARGGAEKDSHDGEGASASVLSSGRIGRRYLRTARARARHTVELAAYR